MSVVRPGMIGLSGSSIASLSAQWSGGGARKQRLQSQPPWRSAFWEIPVRPGLLLLLPGSCRHTGGMPLLCEVLVDVVWDSPGRRGIASLDANGFDSEELLNLLSHGGVQGYVEGSLASSLIDIGDIAMSSQRSKSAVG